MFHQDISYRFPEKYEHFKNSSPNLASLETTEMIFRVCKTNVRNIQILVEKYRLSV